MPRAAKPPRRLNGLIAGLVVVLAAGAFVCWLLRDDSAAETPRPATPRHNPIQEVAPALAPKSAESPAPKPAEKEKPKDPHAGMRLASNGVWQPADRPYKAGRRYVHGVFTNRVGRSDNGVARGAVEQVMLQIFSRDRGDMPMPLPDYLPENEMRRLTEILLDTHEISDKDAESVKLSKEILNTAKEAMRKYIKEGGEPEDFIVDYHEELERSFYTRNDAQLFVHKMIADGEDPEIVEAFVEKTNQKLDEQGIKRIHNPNTVEVKK